MMLQFIQGVASDSLTRKLNLTPAKIQKWRNIASCNKETMERILETSINEREYFAIKEVGFPGFVLLKEDKGIDFALAALVSGKGMAELAYELLENRTFISVLNTREADLLDTIVYLAENDKPSTFWNRLNF